jgi:hypothetical protein
MPLTSDNANRLDVRGKAGDSMMRRRTVQLGQKWPEGFADNVFWIGMDPMQSGVQHADGLVILGRECRTLAELEVVARQIQEDLHTTLEEARQKLSATHAGGELKPK